MLRYMLCLMASDDDSAEKVRNIMVIRLPSVLVLLGSHVRPDELREASDVNTTTSIYMCIFWIYWSYHVFQSWASFDYIDSHIRFGTDGLLNLVPGVVFPNGL